MEENIEHTRVPGKDGSDIHQPDISDSLKKFISTQPDCSNHPRDLFGEKDMKVVAEKIGNLHYEVLAELLDGLANKFARDAITDAKGGRYQLATELNAASHNIHEAFENIEGAWHYSKPFMQPHSLNDKNNL